MGVNLVNTADGKELINLMNDTVSEATLLSGETAHNAAGEQIVGQFTPYTPNLLDNGDFSVNQKGLTEYTEGGYTVDRWKAHKGLVLTKTDTGINLQNTTDGTLSFLQLLSHSHKLLGKTVTMSISVNGVVYTKTTVIPTTSPNASSPAMGIPNVVSVYVYYQADGNLAFVVRVVAGVSLSVEWAGLFPGAVNVKDLLCDDALESLKCQRFLQFHTKGDVDPIDLRPTMRVTPTVTQMEDGRWMYSAEL